MYQGKYGNTNPAASASRRGRRRRLNPRFVVMASILTLLIGMVGGSLAYLITSTDPVKNVFTPGSVTPDITEEFDGSVKKNVAVKNTGDVSAYIRAKVLITWQYAGEGEENGNVLNELPVKDTNYTVSYTKNSGWVYRSDDGYYYYTSPVGAQQSTNDLIDELRVISEAPQEGYTLHVEILSQAIQADGVTADGTKAVVAAWGVDPSDLA